MDEARHCTFGAQIEHGRYEKWSVVMSSHRNGMRQRQWQLNPSKKSYVVYRIAPISMTDE